MSYILKMTATSSSANKESQVKGSRIVNRGSQTSAAYKHKPQVHKFAISAAYKARINSAPSASQS